MSASKPWLPCPRCDSTDTETVSLDYTRALHGWHCCACHFFWWQPTKVVPEGLPFGVKA